MEKICKCVGKKTVTGSNSAGPFRFVIGHFVCRSEGEDGSEVFSAPVPNYCEGALEVGAEYVVQVNYAVPNKPRKVANILYLSNI